MFTAVGDLHVDLREAIEQEGPSVAAPPTALTTPESILLDGGNGVSAASRAHFPDAALYFGLALVVLVVARALPRRPWVALGLLVLGAVPGLVHVLAFRADAPLARPAFAGLIRQRVDELKARAPWPGQVQVVREEDDVFFPLGRYALPSRPVVDGGVLLELGSGPLDGPPCRERAGRISCGVVP